MHHSITSPRLVRLAAPALAVWSGLVVVELARLLVLPPRRRIFAAPRDIGLAYEDALFPASDGVRLSGWFIPAGATSRPTVVLVHSLGWNRSGTPADSRPERHSGAKPVELLRLIHTLHREGYHVLSFDLRSHGRSAAAGPVTFGVQEAHDLLGALEYLRKRGDLDPRRIGVIGFGMGANTLLYALPHVTTPLAAVAIEPATPAGYAERYGRAAWGQFGRLIVRLVLAVYYRAGGVALSTVLPLEVARSAGPHPLLFVQGSRDPYGSLDEVRALAEFAPRAEPLLVVDAPGRDGAYRHIVSQPEAVLRFLADHLQTATAD